MERIKELLETHNQNYLNDNKPLIRALKRQDLKDAIQLVEDNLNDVDDLPF